MEELIKLNIGASPIWENAGWSILDHKLNESTEHKIAGSAENIALPDQSCQAIFCSHVFEHIPHVQLPLILSEINRVLVPGGILRILTPNLERICKAYVEKDNDFFNQALEEDETIRKDLGFGGMLMNFIVSPGQDTVLINRQLNKFIAGYAHLYSYDYDMLSTILKSLGFVARKAEFCDSEIEEMQTPLHIQGMAPTWQPLNQSFYESHGLTHKLINGQYVIDFKVTGFDRDPVTSLIIEAKKSSFVSRDEANQILNESRQNYNRYSNSILRDADFRKKLEEANIKAPSYENT